MSLLNGRRALTKEHDYDEGEGQKNEREDQQGLAISFDEQVKTGSKDCLTRRVYHEETSLVETRFPE